MKQKDVHSKNNTFCAKVKGYVDLLRPFTLIPPFFVSLFIMIASLIYNNELGVNPSWWVTAVQASFTLTLLNAASNILNQAADVEADIISKPYRPIPRGVVKPNEAHTIAYLLYLLVLFRALTINIRFGTIVALIMFFTITYSLPPRVKRFLFLNQIWVAIPRGALGILASWSVFGYAFQREPLTIAVMASLFLVGGTTTKDIVDSAADRKTGTYTLINTYGTKKAAYISLPFLILPFLSIPVFALNNLLARYLLPLTVFAIPSFLVFYLMVRGSRTRKLENVHAWAVMYLEYLFFAICFAALVILGETGYTHLLF
ncbi:MAG TPA: 4-hydroxybenzoate polyprenyltransferase [Thermoplasmatales archaeon]|nr:4-hydroxybenzoate polyprenyltransferase [Thermoplasmatales archaeon]